MKPRIEKLRRRAGRVDVQYTDRAFGDFGGGPITLVLHRLLGDDLDRCRRFKHRESQPGCAGGGALSGVIAMPARGVGVELGAGALSGVIAVPARRWSACRPARCELRLPPLRSNRAYGPALAFSARLRR